MGMGLTLTDKQRIQEFREKLFPENRIAFWSSRDSAYYDTKLFEDYMRLGDDDSVVDRLRVQMAKNNYLAEITREQFRFEAKFLGYDPADANKMPRYDW